MKPLPLLLLLASLGGCSAASDPFAPRAGLWEVRTSFVGLEGPGVTPDRVAALRKAFPATVARECLTGEPDHVGDVKMDGRCTVTRVSDAGSVTDSEWRCEARGKQGPVTSTTHGSRGPERYDYRIATLSVERGDAKPTIVTTRDQARRIGDCPKP